MQADDLAPPIGITGHGTYRRHRDDATALALGQVGGVEPEIRPLAGQRPIEEGADPLVDVLAWFGDGGLREAGQTHGLHEVIERRVETPPIQASWMTATSAFSEVLRGSRKGGK